MKKLSDYKNEEALDLWADLLDPMTKILGDPEMQKVFRSGKPPFLIAKEILSAHKAEAIQIMLRVDDTPVDGLNILTRLVGLVLELMNNEDMKSFFVSAGQAMTE